MSDSSDNESYESNNEDESLYVEVSKTKESKKLEDKYKKMSQEEHILNLPDTYIGSIEKTNEQRYIYDQSLNCMVERDITYVPGLYKIFDEIIVNARDHHVRDSSLKTIKVEINQQEGYISVYNDGSGLEVEIHKQHNVYIPELVFAHLLTSANYNKDENKITGGKNGFGAKLTNIYSKKFIIETVDSRKKIKKKYVQVFEDNMKIKNKPKITSNSSKSYTKITFYPDCSKFGIDGITNDIVEVFKRRVYDLAGTLPNTVSVYYNDKIIKQNTFEKYVGLYLNYYDENKHVYEKVNDRWEIVLTLSPPDSHFKHVSFVNGINTPKGGKHVEYVINLIVKKLTDYIHKKKKKKVKPIFIKDNLWLFLNSTIVNPSFDSQTKETLTTNQSKFGSKFEINNKFIEKLSKIGLIERALEMLESKENKDLKKTDGVKKNSIRGIPKLDDANLAGTAKSDSCTLILTEGDSAKTFAVSGLSIIGRDNYGVFPLRGKLLNVREASADQLIKNAEINNLKKIIGLRKDKIYNSLKELRYGSIMILTDADVDGSHIKGLIFNMFHYFWPSLFKTDSFIKSMITPVVKVTKGSTVKSFYSLTEYQDWKEANNNGKGWNIKYYKGLGTSTAAEAKDYFKDLTKNQVKYIMDEEKIEEIEDKKENEDNVEKTDEPTENEDESDKEEDKPKKGRKVPKKKKVDIKIGMGNKSDNSIVLAFDKRYADNRKKWLSTYDRNEIIEHSQKSITYSEFINKELIHFSNYDNERSIPNICDGLKPSQRKVLFGSLKKNLVKEIKVSQLSGYISEQSSYHHGEASLQGTIISMAHNFIGSNNINLLNPNGQFGTRLLGGKDSASPRYIFTNLNNLTKLIFHQDDLPLLDYLNDDGFKIEPRYYVPIIPMILINGCEGIGTGFSTKIPCYNPVDIVNNLKNMMNGEEIKEMSPWYRGYNGNIIKLNDSTYISRGKYSFVDTNTVIIDELPIGVWTDNYKELLEKYTFDPSSKDNKKKYLITYENHSTESTVKFILKFQLGVLQQFKYKLEKFENEFHLCSHINLSNMHLHNETEKIVKYSNVNDILSNFYDTRYLFYYKRKDFLMRKLQRELEILKSKVRFIQEIMDEVIVIFRKKREIVNNILEENDYKKFDLTSTVLDKDCDLNGNYNYLVNMPIYSFTKDKIDELDSQMNDKQSEYDSLDKKTEKDLWNDDLDAFLEKYQEFIDEYEESIKNETSIGTTKKIKRTKKNKKTVTI